MKEKNENKASRAKIDPALVAQARTGDQSAFTALYEQTHTALYRSIRSMVHDEDLAWDILQDCYLKAFQGLDKLEADGAFLTWLRRIAVNETASRMSKRLPVTFTELGDEEDDSQPELPDLNPDVQPELALDRQETSRLVREILAELPEQQQLIVGMRYYEDLSIKEIAELLHLTSGTIKTQLHFGRKKVETKVRALEKQGLKLYGLAPFPFLLALLRNLEPGEALGQKALSAVLTQAPTAAGTAAAGGAASLSGAVCEAEAVKLTAMTAGQAIRHGLAAKLAAGALALCVIGGGIWAGSKALKRESPNIGDLQFSVTETEHARPTQEPTTPTTEPIQTEEPFSTEPARPGESEVSTESNEAQPRHSFDSPEAAYDYVLDQYRQALADPAFAAENYPLVNADTVSTMAMRWSRYADDEGLYAIHWDIDGNGIQELIITQPTPEKAFNQTETYNKVSAVYAWNGAEAVELLGEIGFTKDDYVTIYDSGVIRCVKNGYYTSPAQVTEYRLDAEQAALREERQWIYTCTETGECSYRAADGMLLTRREFYADSGTPISISHLYWDEEARENREMGYYFASNPGTAENPPVTDWEDLPAEKAERCRLPQITLEGEAFENFNREIQQMYLTEGGKGYNWDDISYTWSLNGDVLCVSVYTWGGGLFPEGFWRFSVSEARELTEDELLERCGMSRAAFKAGLTPALNGAYGRLFDTFLYFEELDDSSFDYDRNRRLICEGDADPASGPVRVDISESASRLVLDRNGGLAYIVELPSPVGGDHYYQVIPVQWGN